MSPRVRDSRSSAAGTVTSSPRSPALRPMVIASVTLHALIAVGLVWGPTWIPRPKLQTYEVQLVSLPAEPAPIREVPPPVAPRPRPPKPDPEPKPAAKPAVKPAKKPAEAVLPPSPKRGTHVAEAPVEVKPVVEPPPEPPEQLASIPQAAADAGITLVTPLMEAVALKYPYYTNVLLRKMDANWSPPGVGLATMQEVLVTFTILRDGSVRGTNIEQSSGNLYYDQAALRTVLRSSPFPPLPPGYAGETMTVHFSFLLDPERGP